MDLGLAGLRAVVTGSTAGIGAAIAESLLHEGCDVAICSRSQDRVDAMLERASGHSGRAIGKAIDVNDADRFSNWLGEVALELDGIDIFVPNVSAMPGTGWDELIETNIRSIVEATEATFPYLDKSEHASIVCIGSKASTMGTPGVEAYGAAKAAITHYMKSLALRLVDRNIRVNVVSPGDTFFEGGFWDRMKDDAPQVYEETLASNPMGRLGTPEEVANVVAFLASPAASFVSGAHILVDGAQALGMCMAKVVWIAGAAEPGR